MINFFKLYFGKGSFLFLEIAFLVSASIAWVSHPHPFYYAGVVGALLFLGLFFIKITRVVSHLKLMSTGFVSEAELLNIESTNVKVNKRRVKKYHFRYNVEGNLYDTFITSNRYMKWRVGQKFKAYYPPQTPEKAFVPGFYGVKDS